MDVAVSAVTEGVLFLCVEPKLFSLVTNHSEVD